MNHNVFQKHIIVKFVAKGSVQQNHQVWLRQFPHGLGIWGGCRFVFDPETTAYDWLVVYDDLPCLAKERFSTRREVLACPRENTLLITTEPVTVKTYNATFLGQFGHVLTSQEQAVVRHPNARFSQPGLRWFYGIGRDGYRTYDQMKATKPPHKTHIISTVCSSKQQRHTLHNLRYHFTKQLRDALPELDHFGRGVQSIDDKAQALDPYKYHLTIENHVCEHHWTEKLSDPFLGYCLPIYCGCPNAHDYFPKESYISIDLFDIKKSYDIIRNALDNNEYNKRLPAIIEARRLVLDEYNIFALVSKFIEEKNVSRSSIGREVISSRRMMRIKYPFRHLGDFVLIFSRRHKNIIRSPLWQKKLR